MSERRYFREDHVRIIEMRREGLSLRKIAQLLGMPKSMCSVLSRYGGNLPLAEPGHYKHEPNRVIRAATGEELFQHDPYYKF
jgi:DNA-binding transcriptional MerR regulator